MSLQVKLPPELLDRVIDFLHDDITNLKACSLVSWEWVASSQLHLFRNVQLRHCTRNDATSSTDCHRLYDVLSSSPGLSRCVKYLVAHGGLPIGFFPEPCLPSLLRVLTSLRSLHILPTPTLATYTVIMNDVAVAAISSAVSTSLEELRINTCMLPYAADVLRILHSCPRLKVLHLSNIRFHFEPTTVAALFADHKWNTERKMGGGAILDVISLDSSIIAESFLHPLSPIDISSVRELRLKIHPELSITGIELIEAASSVERLEVDLITDRECFLLFFVSSDTHSPAVKEDQLEALSLSNNPQLRFLILRVPVFLGRFNPLPWMYSLLSTISPTNTLEELSVDVIIDMPPPRLTVPVYETSILGWKHLDSLLVHPQFSALKRVRFDFSLDNTLDDQIVPSILDDILLQLSALGRRGILHVDTCEIR